jgi:hypothetical protein
METHISCLHDNGRRKFRCFWLTLTAMMNDFLGELLFCSVNDQRHENDIFV